VEIRREQRERKRRDRERAGGSHDSVVPITVRQLEALVRLSEGLAKVTLSEEATEEHVEEALRLFRVSTLNAANSGLGEHFISDEMREEVKRIEARITRDMHVSATAATARVKGNLLKSGFGSASVDLAMRVMQARGEIRFLHERRTVQRVR